MINWTCSLTFEDTSDPAGLHFSLGHDGSKGMDEAHYSQSGMLHVGRKDVLVQTNTVPRLVQSSVWQVRKIVAVTCGEHDGIDLL